VSGWTRSLASARMSGVERSWGLFRRPSPSVRELDAAELAQQAESDDEADLVEIEIHGESFRQETLEALAGPKEADGKHVVEGVTLRCEPSNPHDPNAVRVEVMGQLVGYVARDQAPVVSQGMQRSCGGVLEERGLIVGGWRDRQSEGHYGIRVWLTRRDADRIGLKPSAPPPLETLAPWPEIPKSQRDERRLSPSLADLQAKRWGSKVTVVGEEHYQDVIVAALPEAWDRHYCPALVELAIAPCNPHAQHPVPCVEVRIAGHSVGYFTPKMTDRYRNLIERAIEDGLRATALATVRQAEKGGVQIWRVQVEMQRIS